MKKIVAFTAIRSEYDLLSSLFKYLTNDKNIEFKLVVSGAHLSKEFGYSINDIKNDGHKILAEIDSLNKKDDITKRVKSAATLMKEAIDVIFKYKPDLIIYAGDREEVMIASIIGGYLEIPTMHFFGGDHVQDSHIDNPIRHATSKLSTIHMVSTAEHQQRLLKMGEKAERIYNIGSVALDKFTKETILNKRELSKYFHLDTPLDKFTLIIFHPIPKERKESAKIFKNILTVLKEYKLKTFVSYPNIDPGSQDIINIINEYKNDDNFIFYKTLPRKEFLSIYKNASILLGNSSSGILESASIPIPAINIGFRQTGRKANENLIFSGTSQKEIRESLDLCFSDDFQDKVKICRNIYGDGNSSQKAYDIIKNNDFKKLLFKDEDILEQNNE